MRNEMKKRGVTCYEEYTICNGVYNIKVYWADTDFGYDIRLCQCTRCGELYVMEFGDYEYGNMKLPELVLQRTYVKCEAPLGTSLKYYPDTFLAPNGSICHHTPSGYVPADRPTVVIYAWEIDYRVR